jgi:hypothetical protein
MDFLRILLGSASSSSLSYNTQIDDNGDWRMEYRMRAEEKALTDAYLKSLWSRGRNETAVVYLIMSPLHLTKPDVLYERFPFGGAVWKALTGAHTTHWGLRVRDRFYDLRRKGKWPNAKADFEPSEVSKSQRKVLEEVAIGITHFNDEDIAAIGT